uniref:Uncharacterized protein n=1 Tax=Hyaloperonospora arabidopsidis (strain Emoy2) TaxID=559515 RepID=M4C219_HYAAE
MGNALFINSENYGTFKYVVSGIGSFDVVLEVAKACESAASSMARIRVSCFRAFFTFDQVLSRDSGKRTTQIFVASSPLYCQRSRCNSGEGEQCSHCP